MRTRDALEPLLAAFDAVAAERDGRVAVRGRAAVEGELAADALALPERGASVSATRTLEARPSTVRVRYIDETADYQTGAVVVRSDDQGATGGGVDLDLPVVCGGGLAKAAALDVLTGAGMEAVTVALGPLDAMRLEPGDMVRLEGRAGDWRVMRTAADETPFGRVGAGDGKGAAGGRRRLARGRGADGGRGAVPETAGPAAADGGGGRRAARGRGGGGPLADDAAARRRKRRCPDAARGHGGVGHGRDPGSGPGARRASSLGCCQCGGGAHRRRGAGKRGRGGDAGRGKRRGGRDGGGVGGDPVSIRRPGRARNMAADGPAAGATGNRGRDEGGGDARGDGGVSGRSAGAGRDRARRAGGCRWSVARDRRARRRAAQGSGRSASPRRASMRGRGRRAA